MSVEWKKLLQHGVIKFRDQDGVETEVPFTLALRATYDVKQE